MLQSRSAVLIFALVCALTVSVKAGVPVELEFDDANSNSTGVLRSGSGEFFHVEYFPTGQTSTDAAKSVEFFQQPLSTDRLDQLIEGHLQTTRSI